MALGTSPLLLDRVSFWAILAVNMGANLLFAIIYGVLAGPRAHLSHVRSREALV